MYRVRSAARCGGEWPLGGALPTHADVSASYRISRAECAVGAVDRLMREWSAAERDRRLLAPFRSSKPRVSPDAADHQALSASDLGGRRLGMTTLRSAVPCISVSTRVTFAISPWHGSWKAMCSRMSVSTRSRARSLCGASVRWRSAFERTAFSSTSVPRASSRAQCIANTVGLRFFSGFRHRRARKRRCRSTRCIGAVVRSQERLARGGGLVRRGSATRYVPQSGRRGYRFAPSRFPSTTYLAGACRIERATETVDGISFSVGIGGESLVHGERVRWQSRSICAVVRARG